MKRTVMGLIALALFVGCQLALRNKRAPEGSPAPMMPALLSKCRSNGGLLGGKPAPFAATAPRPLILYLNFDGGTVMNQLPEDSALDQADLTPVSWFQVPRYCTTSDDPTQMPGCCTTGQPIPIPTFQSLDKAWQPRYFQVASIKCQVENLFREYDVTVLLTKPSMDHTVVHFGGNEKLGCVLGAAGVSPLPQLGPREEVLVFTDVIASFQGAGVIAAHEVGHSLGLHHVDNRSSIMYVDNSAGTQWLGGHVLDNNDNPTSEYEDTPTILATRVVKRDTPLAERSCDFPGDMITEPGQVRPDRGALWIFLSGGRRILNNFQPYWNEMVPLIGRNVNASYRLGVAPEAQIVMYHLLDDSPLIGAVKVTNGVVSVISFGQGDEVFFEGTTSDPAVLALLATKAGAHVMVLGALDHVAAGSGGQTRYWRAQGWGPAEGAY